MAMTWREAIQMVLQEEGGPLHYAEISEKVLSRGYYRTEGATPDATVNAQISASIKHDRENTPFVRVGKGVFALRNFEPLVATTPALHQSTEATASEVVIPPAEVNQELIATSPDGTPESIIRCLGMYWQRELIVWRNDPRIYGKQQASSRAVDFGGQRGIYVLYDHHTVVYVGRSVDRPLGKRLNEHTGDRLASRWNRFSWFGLLDVTDEGSLIEVELRVSLQSLIATLEALMIETLEPPQNRKRGDDFSVMEYIQAVDPELKERELQNTLRAIEQKLRGQSQ